MKLNSLIPAVVLWLMLSHVPTTLANQSVSHPELASSRLPETLAMIGKNLMATSSTNDMTNEGGWHTVQVFSGKGNLVTTPFQVTGTKWQLNWNIKSDFSPDTGLIIHIFRKDKPYAIWQTIFATSSKEGQQVFPIETETGEEFFLKVFARNLAEWTIMVQDNSQTTPIFVVEISRIYYKGERYSRDTENCICYEIIEPDEYVVISNTGNRPQKMGGWTLKNVTKGYPTFTFPLDFVLNPGQSVIVTTNKVYPDCGAWLEFGTDAPYCTNTLWFSFFFGPGDIWDNKVPNIAVLYDARGQEVSRKSYTVSK